MPRVLTGSLTFAALLILVGCAPKLNPQLVPVQAEVRWVQGAAWVEQVQDGLTVKMSCQYSAVNVLRFSVEVANRGGKAVLVTPEVVEVAYTEGLQLRTSTAADPEKQIQAYISQEEKERANRAGTAAFVGLFSLVDMVDTVGNTSKRSRQENREVWHDRNDFYRDAANSQEISHNQSERLANGRWAWEQTFLRRSTVEPGQGVHGFIQFYVDARASQTVTLKVPVDGKVFEFAFKPRE